MHVASYQVALSKQKKNNKRTACLHSEINKAEMKRVIQGRYRHADYHLGATLRRTVNILSGSGIRLCAPPQIFILCNEQEVDTSLADNYLRATLRRTVNILQVAVSDSVHHLKFLSLNLKGDKNQPRKIATQHFSIFHN